MLNKEFTINCSEGFHLRPAQVLMETATPFQSEIIVEKNADEEADAKSILGLMSLGLEKGEKVVLKISGPDENLAMKAVEELFNNNFGE
jgi:phosphotransferase system HPr (HPr) family protein